MELSNNKKYQLIVEHSLHDRHTSPPLVVEVVKETPTMYFTPEIFSVNLRDFCPRYMRQKQVRWVKESGRRSGDRDAQVRFKVKEVLRGDAVAAIQNAIVITA